MRRFLRDFLVRIAYCLDLKPEDLTISIRAFLSVLALVGLGFTLQPASAQDAKQKPAAKPGQNQNQSAKLISSDWKLDCRPVGPNRVVVCEGSKRVALQQNRQLLLAIFVTPVTGQKGKKSYILRYQLPHGLNLTAGLKVDIDKKAIAAPVIVTTSQAGVFARSNLTKKLTDAMGTGKVMTVQFSGLNGSVLSVPVSMAGFSAIFAKMK